MFSGKVIQTTSIKYFAIFKNGIAIGFNPKKVSEGKESLIKHTNDAYNRNCPNGALYECSLLKFKKRSKKELEEFRQKLIEFHNLTGNNYMIVDKNLRFKKGTEEF